MEISWQRKLKGQLANPGLSDKVAVKTECVCKYTDSVIDC